MMIVKSPLKKNISRPNRPVRPAARKNGKGNNFTSNGNGNGTVYGRKKKKTAKKISLPEIRAWKVILGAVAIGLLGVLYLGHVFATQKLLQEVQQIEREYNKMKLRHADYRLTYDHLTGPKEIYEKASERGFINGGPADKVITVEEN